MPLSFFCLAFAGQTEDRTLSTRASDSCNHYSESPVCTDVNKLLDHRLLDQLAKAKRKRILEFSPEDEVEGEMLYLQNKLVDNALAIKHSFG